MCSPDSCKRCDREQRNERRHRHQIALIASAVGLPASQAENTSCERVWAAGRTLCKEARKQTNLLENPADSRPIPGLLHMTVRPLVSDGKMSGTFRAANDMV